MMKSRIIYLLLCLPMISFSQNTTYIGIEFGPKFENYEHLDNGVGLDTKSFFYSPIYGLTFGKILNNTFTLETGFYINEYGESYRTKGDLFRGSSNAFLAYQIPLRLKAHLNIIKDRLSLVTTTGYTFVINRDFGGWGSGSVSSDVRTIEYLTNYSPKRTYGLIETGLGLDYKLKNAMTLSLAANLLSGFSRIVETYVTYSINEESEQTATVFSNGGYYNIVFGIKYPISNLWTKKTE